MNNEIPERIYHDPVIGNFGYEECEGDTAYVREDIVQGLVESLKEAAELFESASEGVGVNFYQCAKDARAALARVKEGV